MAVLYARYPQALYQNKSFRTTSHKLREVSGEISLEQVVDVDYGYLTTMTDLEGIILKLRIPVDILYGDVEYVTGWVRLVRLCPGDEYDSLCKKFSHISFPKCKKDWPKIGNANPCTQKEEPAY